MKYPQIKSALAVDNYTILVEFSSSERKKYDITPLLKTELFEPFKDPIFFKNFSIDTSGYGLIWNEDVDISEYELWIHGIPIT